jgi:hypothetical protein
MLPRVGPGDEDVVSKGREEVSTHSSSAMTMCILACGVSMLSGCGNDESKMERARGNAQTQVSIEQPPEHAEATSRGGTFGAGMRLDEMREVVPPEFYESRRSWVEERGTVRSHKDSSAAQGEER